MSDDERIARLTEIARRAWPGEADVCIDWQPEHGSAAVRTDAVGELVLLIESHPRALDALEAALLVLASGETWAERMGELNECVRALRAQADAEPAWVEQLAADMERGVELGAECDAVGTAVAACTKRWAAELRARVKGGER